MAHDFISYASEPLATWSRELEKAPLTPEKITLAKKAIEQHLPFAINNIIGSLLQEWQPDYDHVTDLVALFDAESFKRCNVFNRMRNPLIAPSRYTTLKPLIDSLPMDIPDMARENLFKMGKEGFTDFLLTQLEERTVAYESIHDAIEFCYENNIDLDFERLGVQARALRPMERFITNENGEKLFLHELEAQAARGELVVTTLLTLFGASTAIALAACAYCCMEGGVSVPHVRDPLRHLIPYEEIAKAFLTNFSEEAGELTWEDLMADFYNAIDGRQAHPFVDPITYETMLPLPVMASDSESYNFNAEKRTRILAAGGKLLNWHTAYAYYFNSDLFNQMVDELIKHVADKPEVVEALQQLQQDINGYFNDNPGPQHGSDVKNKNSELCVAKQETQEKQKNKKKKKRKKGHGKHKQKAHVPPPEQGDTSSLGGDGVMSSPTSKLITRR